MTQATATTGSLGTTTPTAAPLGTVMETVICDLCQSSESVPYMQVRDRIYDLPGQFELVRCQSCGLIYLNPRPDQASIGAYYPGMDYHAFKQSGGLKAALLNRLRVNEATSMMNGLPDRARILEIGCATGEMLVALRDLGAEVSGVEPSPQAAAWARDKNGLNVLVGLLDDQHLPDNQFDLVLMRYALEHVHSPRGTLAEIRRILKPGGKAVLWVPNAASLDSKLFGEYWRGLDAPRHLYIFTPETMKKLVEAAGLRLSELSFNGVPNDWAGSLEAVLRERGLPAGLTRWFGVSSPLALAGWLPVSMTAAALRNSGRIRVTAVKAS